ncbi:hypothetical protein MBLNU230_g4754t1 [Neophaeotheca triangularis]
MSAARWAQRLPRATTQLIETTSTRRVANTIPQRRWAQHVPKRSRPWAGGGRNQENNEKDLQQMEREPEIESRNPGASEQPSATEQPADQPGRNQQLATALAESASQDLVTEVKIPEDVDGVLPPKHPALAILGNSSLVIQRQLEMMNVMLGFEQANRYIIMDGQGQTLGYLAETDHGIGQSMKRQFFKTHRSFTTHIFDKDEREVLRIHRPFAYINSRIRIYDPVPEGGYQNTEASNALQGLSASSVANPSAAGAQISPLKLEEMRIIGEAQQQWAPLRRKYNLFSYRPIDPALSPEASPQRIESGEKASSDTKAVTVTENETSDRAIEAGMSQFANINEPFLSWDFTLRDEEQRTIGSVNRNFAGFAREIFTDTGVYALRMDSAGQMSALQDAEGKDLQQYEREATAMTLDQRAVMLATAVSVDFDYFSRHSGSGMGGGFMPLWLPGMGGGAAEGGAAGGAAGAGAAGEAGAAGAGTAVGEAGAMEGAAGMAGRGATGAAESGIAGAGTMAGYEAMQRGAYGGGQSGVDDASPTAAQPNDPFNAGSQNPDVSENRPGNEVWGEDQDPWGGGGDGGPPPPSAGDGGGEGGGGWFDTISDFFGDD